MVNCGRFQDATFGQRDKGDAAAEAWLFGYATAFPSFAVNTNHYFSVNLERKALRDVVLPNGMVIPRGTNIAIDSSMMWDAEIYPDPLTYDPYRFLRLRESGNSAIALASTSPEHIAFGIGKPICPGRFFASNEIKIALAKILLSYDVRLAGKVKPKVLELGFEMLSDPEARLEVRKRSLS